MPALIKTSSYFHIIHHFFLSLEEKSLFSKKKHKKNEFAQHATGI